MTVFSHPIPPPDDLHEKPRIMYERPHSTRQIGVMCRHSTWVRMRHTGRVGSRGNDDG